MGGGVDEAKDTELVNRRTAMNALWMVIIIIINAGTACSNRVKWQIPQSFNLIELGDRKRGAIEIFRIAARGEQELIFSRGHQEEVT